MSFGYSVGDAVLLTHLAWKTVQNARKACGEHDELTREVVSLHVVLRRLEQEVEKPGNPIHDGKSSDTYKEELKAIVDGCKKVLNVLDQVLTKYNTLSEQERSGRKIWQKIRFGNGKMADLVEMRGKLAYYTSAISLYLNMVSMGTMGRVERQMNKAGGDLKEIKIAVNGITAHLMSSVNRHEGSVLTAYADDDRAVWKEFRRELVEDGFSSSVIRKHKVLIRAYIEELGNRGLFDDEDPNGDAEEQYCDVDSVVEGAVVHDPAARSNSDVSLRPNAAVELPVESKSPLDYNTESNTAFHLQTESREEQRPTNGRVSRTGSQSEPRSELRWIWLGDKSNGKTVQSPAEETGAPKFEFGPSTATTDREHHRSNDAEEKPTGVFESFVEDDWSNTEVDGSSYGSERGLSKPRTGDARKRNTEEPSRKNSMREYEKETKEALVRDWIRKLRVSRNADDELEFDEFWYLQR